MNTPKDEEVEKKIKLKIIFNLGAISIGMKETQLVKISEVVIRSKNLKSLYRNLNIYILKLLMIKIK